MAWLVPALGFGFAYVIWRIEKSRHPDGDSWYRPETMLVIWGVLAACDVGLCFFLDLTDQRQKSTDAVPPSVTISSGITVVGEAARLRVDADSLRLEETLVLEQEKPQLSWGIDYRGDRITEIEVEPLAARNLQAARI